MSKDDASSIGIDCTNATWYNNGTFPYTFVQSDEEWCMIIDYGELVRRYTENCIPSNTAELDKIHHIIVLSRDRDGQRIGYSQYLAINN